MQTPTLRKREPTFDTYTATILAARNRQLRLTAANVKRLTQTYNDAAWSIISKLRDMPAGGNMDVRMERAYMENVLRGIDETLQKLVGAFAERLRGGMIEMAQDAVIRERRIQELLGPLGSTDPLMREIMSETITEPDGGTRTIVFGEIAHDAVEALAARYYGDGLKLSDRLWGVDNALRTGIADTMVQAIAEGVSVEETMNRLLDGPLAKHAPPAWMAARIARTEIAHAYSEAHLRSVLDPKTGKLRDGVTGVKWHLSTSHPKPDICDVWATYDTGRGPGVYSDMSAVPSDHPNGLCLTTTVLEAWRETGEWRTGQTPTLEGISDTELQYHADHGDAAAQSRLTG